MGLKKQSKYSSFRIRSKNANTIAKTAFELPKTELSGTFGQINSQAQDKNFGISQSFNPFSNKC